MPYDFRNSLFAYNRRARANLLDVQSLSDEEPADVEPEVQRLRQTDEAGAEGRETRGSAARLEL